MPEISIIVPVYQVELYLRRCIDSILAQTFTDFELILVDDGSPDQCGTICDDYQKKDRRIQVIHQKNGGLSSARNAGLDRSNGKYIGFVDSDDYVSPALFQKLYDAISADDSDLSICNFFFVDENETVLTKPNDADLEVKTYFQEQGDSLVHLINVNWKYIVAWNKLYKKELFQKTKFPPRMLHEDEFVIHHILHQCKRVCVINDKLYYYVQTEQSIMRSEYNIHRMDALTAYVDRILFFYQHGYDKDAKMAEKYYWNVLINRYYYFLPDRQYRAVLFRKRWELLKIIVPLSANPIFIGREKWLPLVFFISPRLYKKLFLK